MSHPSDPGTYIEFSAQWRDDGWFSFPRSIARDERISHEARGLLCQLASHTESYRFETTRLAERTRNGRDSVRRMVRELEAAGYLVRRQERDRHGLLGVMIYELHPVPRTGDGIPVDGDRPAADPMTADPVTADRPAENQPSSKKSTQYKEGHTGKPSGGRVTAPEIEPELDLQLSAPEKPITAGAVVAAYVEAFRLAHGGKEPLVQIKSKIGNHARRLLGDPTVDATELILIAERMAGTRYSDLATAYHDALTTTPAGKSDNTIDVVQRECLAKTGRPMPREWASKAALLLLGGGGKIDNPTGYVVAAIRSMGAREALDRLYPHSQPPRYVSQRELAEPPSPRHSTAER